MLSGVKNNGGGCTTTHNRSGRRRRGSPSYPTSAAIPLRSTGFGIYIFTLPVVFVIPLRVALRRFGTRRGMIDSAASRSVFCHIEWEFFLPMRGIPVGVWVGRIANEFKIFGGTG